MASGYVTLALCYGAALAATLVLAAWLTPRRWWRRPNLQALAVLAGGTLALGALLAACVGTRDAAADVATDAPPRPAPAPAAWTPAPGATYRVARALNLRRDSGVHAPRVAVLPAGSLVVATGGAQGDWWQVRAARDGADGADVEGWASSLWLRRTDEGRPAPLE